MKSSIFYIVTLASWAFAAPAVMVVKTANTPHPHSATVKAAILTTTGSRLRTSSESHRKEKIITVDLLGGKLDNRPVTPSDHVSPSEALAAERPLNSAYLLSLANKARPKTQKPSHLEVSSILQEETGTTVTSKDPTIAELESQAARPFYNIMPCVKGGVKHFHKVRQYADMVIVGVVLLFVAIVVMIEVWEPVTQRTKQLFAREGAIRLGDDEESQSQRANPARTPFVLQPAPKSKSRLEAIPEKPEI